MRTKKTKLLVVGAFPPPGNTVLGGNVTDCKNLLDAGLAEYFDLILLDSTQRSVPPSPFRRRLVDSLFRCCKYFRFVLGRRPDAVLLFASTGFSFAEKAVLAAFGRCCGCRVLFSPRGGKLMDDCRRSRMYRFFVKGILNFPTILLCQSETWQKFFTGEMRFPAEKCVVIASGTATPPLLKIGEMRNYDARDTLRILFLGWVCRRKGVFELIDALSLLRLRAPSVELFLAGGGEAFEEAREYAARKGLKKEVYFLGWIDGKEKMEALSKAAIFCLPSHTEGLPNAMIEAMAAGLPVVVTPVGSIPDVIIDRKNGLIIPVRDSHALALALMELIQNPALREQIGRSAYEIAKRNYRPERAIMQLANLIDDLRG